MAAMRVVVFYVLLPILLLGAAIGGIIWHQRASEREALRKMEAAQEADLNTPEGYAARKIHSGLGIRNNDKREVFIGGMVRNEGDRALRSVYIRLQYLTKDGMPKGKGKAYRLGAFKPGQKRRIEIYLYTLDKEDFKPDPRNPMLVRAPLPPYKIVVEKVEFAK
mgnify:CR=1 FL=1